MLSKRMTRSFFLSAIAVLVLLAAATPAFAAQFAVLQSFANSDCSGNNFPLNITIPLGSCLNNHQFDDVECDTLNQCFSALRVNCSAYGPCYASYQSLVDCTGAPAMHLSVYQTVDEITQKLVAKVYALQEQCTALPITLRFGRGECASAFAISKSCGISGSALNWI